MSDSSTDDPERFEAAIMIIAFVFYAAERYFAFVFLDSRTSGAGALESLLRQVLFGRPPYSFLKLLLGFELNQGLFGLVQPVNLLAVTIQVVHFLINYWIVRFPFHLAARITRGKPDRQ
jgi:hypothetical protein